MGLWPFRVISLSLVWLTREENGKTLFLVVGSSFLPLHPHTGDHTHTKEGVPLAPLSNPSLEGLAAFPLVLVCRDAREFSQMDTEACSCLQCSL